MSRTVRIAPSVLSADLGSLAREVEDVATRGADWIHVDVMDGNFVPTLTGGPRLVRAVRSATQLPVDVHLMVTAPERHIEAFAEAGADVISVHIEAVTHAQRALSQIRALGKRAGIVLNPATGEESIRYLLDDIDLVLVMSVNPGFGGQRFLPCVLPKLRALRAMIDAHARDIDLEVDGGIDQATTAAVVDAGADVLVAGQAVFGSQDRGRALSELRAACQGPQGRTNA